MLEQELETGLEVTSVTLIVLSRSPTTHMEAAKLSKISQLDQGAFMAPLMVTHLKASSCHL